MLPDILLVNATLVTQSQNEDMAAQNEEVKKISAWAAITSLELVIIGWDNEHRSVSMNDHCRRDAAKQRRLNSR